MSRPVRELLDGSGAPGPDLGDTGDIYLDTDADQVWIKMDHSTWHPLPVEAGADTTARDAADAAQNAADAAQATADDAQPAAFTADDTDNWTSPPATIQAALDQLALRVQAIEDA